MFYNNYDFQLDMGLTKYRNNKNLVFIKICQSSINLLLRV